MEFSSVPGLDPTAAGEAYDWIDSGETITSPDASAAGGVILHYGNARQLRARLKIVTTAVSDVFVYDGAAAARERG